jgi:microcystin-dependent protein
MPLTPTVNRGYPRVSLDDAPANIETAVNPSVEAIDADVQALEDALTASIAAAQADADAAQASASTGATFVGMIAADAGSGDIVTADQEWMRADGRLIDRTTYAAFFGRVGHKYNGGVDPGSNMVRLPDRRGRVSVGADDMGTAQGAAGRIPNSNRAAGQNGGAEQHGHTVNNHDHTMTAHSHNLGVGGPSASYAGGGSSAPGLAVASNTHTHGGSTVDSSTPQTGGSSPGTNSAFSMQPYVVDSVIVRVR